MSKKKLDHQAVFSSILGDLSGLQDDAEQREIMMDELVFNDSQPRKYIDSASLATLTASIAEKGVLEPILVRPVGGKYEIVAGERRTRAAQAAKLERIPAIIRELTDQQAFEVAIIENLQREDLNPIEETDAILRLISMRLERPTSEVIDGIKGLYNESRGRPGNTGISKSESERIEAIFNALGRFTPGSFYTNRIPLLSLPAKLLEAVRTGTLDYSKAKLLARVPNEVLRDALLNRTIKDNLSRDALEALIQESKQPKVVTKNHTLLSGVKRQLTIKRFDALAPEKQQRVKKLLNELASLLDK